MADVPKALQLPERAFKRLAVDLAGTYKLRGDLRRRSARGAQGMVKVWVAVFACSLSSAVKLYAVRDYSQEGFLQAWHQHIAD
jgi:hypothetical protein